MEQEINATSNNNPMRAKLQPRVKGYQQDIQKAKKDLQRAATLASNSITRDDLFSGASQDYQVLLHYNISVKLLHIFMLYLCLFISFFVVVLLYIFCCFWVVYH